MWSAVPPAGRQASFLSISCQRRWQYAGTQPDNWLRSEQAPLIDILPIPVHRGYARLGRQRDDCRSMATGERVRQNDEPLAAFLFRDVERRDDIADRAHLD